MRGSGCRHRSRRIRSRGFPALPRSLPTVPRKPMACFLPVRPWPSPDPRVFSPIGRPVQSSNRTPGLTSPALGRHPSVLPSPLAVSLPASHADHDPPSKNTSRRLFGPPAFPDPAALLPTPSADAASDRRYPAHRKFRPQGLATLPTVSSARDTLTSLFQLVTLLGFSLQSFPPPAWFVEGFPSTTRSCAFPQNLSRPCAGAPAVSHATSRTPSRSPND